MINYNLASPPTNTLLKYSANSLASVTYPTCPPGANPTATPKTPARTSPGILANTPVSSLPTSPFNLVRSGR